MIFVVGEYFGCYVGNAPRLLLAVSHDEVVCNMGVRSAHFNIRKLLLWGAQYGGEAEYRMLLAFFLSCHGAFVFALTTMERILVYINVSVPV